MTARDIAEPGRRATPLELLFDLCFIVAVAAAGERLHHALSDGYVGSALLSYAVVFFAIWWAWMNFTWFASAYDSDDVPYRIATFVQIAGWTLGRIRWRCAVRGSRSRTRKRRNEAEPFQHDWRVVVHGEVRVARPASVVRSMPVLLVPGSPSGDRVVPSPSSRA